MGTFFGPQNFKKIIGMPVIPDIPYFYLIFFFFFFFFFFFWGGGGGGKHKMLGPSLCMMKN